MGERLEATPKTALRLADPLGNGTDLAVVRAEQNHNPIGITERVGAKDDPLIVSDAHEEHPA
jgi:hypothetical protein